MKWLLRILGVLVALLVIAFLFLRTPDTDPAEMRAKYGGEGAQYVEIGNGVTVHLRDEGPRDGIPVILLHGSAADLHTWDPWVEALSDEYRIIRFDQIGHGLTGPDPDGDYTLENFVSDINEVADALGLETFVLGGNSMGGGHSVAYAIEHPERLSGLILVDAGGAPIRKEGGGNLGFTIARTPVLNQIMKHITPRSMVERSLRQSVTNEGIVTDAAVDRYWELLRYPGNRTATIARFSRDRSSFTPEQVSAIAVPTIILWGEEDSLISVEAARWYAEKLPQSQLVIYDEIGHLPQEEAVAETVADVRNWLSNQFNQSN